MASAEREPITEVRGAKPPEAEAFSALDRLQLRQNFPLGILQTVHNSKIRLNGKES